MNQAQRKHIQERLKTILNEKSNKVQSEFNSKPENRFLNRPVHQYPTQIQILQKLAGFESPAVLKIEGEELKEALRRHPNMAPNIFVHPVNQSEMDAYLTKDAEIAERRRTEVEMKVMQLRNRYNHYNDILMLSKDEAYILRCIEDFAAMET